MTKQFFYTTVQTGFEPALEAEVQDRFPDWKVVEALKGWRLYEREAAPDWSELANSPSFFSRSWGHYLGTEPEPWARLELKISF